MKFDKKDKNSIKNMFNQIAPNYDILNNLMTFGLQTDIKKKAILNIKNDDYKTSLKILDLCTGTGDIAIIFKELYPNSQIIGVDFSDNMLKIAQTRTHKVNFIQKDITNLGTHSPFEEESFDICFIGFGLRNLPSIDNFLENIKKYIKPNGIISILDLGKPMWFMRPYFWLHYEFYIPFLAFLYNQNISAYKYLAKSTQTYPSPTQIITKLKQHKFTNTININYYFGIISQQIARKA